MVHVQVDPSTALQNVVKAERLVAEQRARIEVIAASGQPTQTAEAILARMIEDLEQMRQRACELEAQADFT